MSERTVASLNTHSRGGGLMSLAKIAQAASPLDDHVHLLASVCMDGPAFANCVRTSLERKRFLIQGDAPNPAFSRHS
jgi:hypothetical protein